MHQTSESTLAPLGDSECGLCRNSNLERVTVRDAKSNESICIATCPDCGLVQFLPRPSAEELEAWYAHEYRNEYKRTRTPRPGHVHRAGNLALERLAFLRDAGARDGRLLDVGAGGGEFVHLASRIGFSATGVEPSEGYAAHARDTLGADIRTTTLEQAEGEHDVVTVFHVVEHLRDPVLAFQRLRSRLRPGGLLYVEVPWVSARASSPSNRWFRAHLYYFSAATLAAAASPDFEVVRVATDRNLSVVFRARAERGPLVLPDAATVDADRRANASAGWAAYLFGGGGLVKPGRQIARMLRESRVTDMTPAQILEQRLASDQRFASAAIDAVEARTPLSA